MHLQTQGSCQIIPDLSATVFVEVGSLKQMQRSSICLLFWKPLSLPSTVELQAGLTLRPHIYMGSEDPIAFFNWAISPEPVTHLFKQNNIQIRFFSFLLITLIFPAFFLLGRSARIIKPSISMSHHVMKEKLKMKIIDFCLVAEFDSVFEEGYFLWTAERYLT